MPSNLKQASQRAIIKSKSAAAANVGGASKLEVEEVVDSMELAIGEFIQKVIENISTKLQTSGNITNITAEKSDTGWRIIAPAYLDFQSKGVNGVEVTHNSPYSFKPGVENAPPPSALKDWSESRGLNPFAVSKSLQKKGITPKRLWEDEVDELAKKVTEAVAETITNSISPQPIKKEVNVKL